MRGDNAFPSHSQVLHYHRMTLPTSIGERGHFKPTLSHCAEASLRSLHDWKLRIVEKRRPIEAHASERVWAKYNQDVTNDRKRAWSAFRKFYAVWRHGLLKSKPSAQVLRSALSKGLSDTPIVLNRLSNLTESETVSSNYYVILPLTQFSMSIRATIKISSASAYHPWSRYCANNQWTLLNFGRHLQTYSIKNNGT